MTYRPLASVVALVVPMCAFTPYAQAQSVTCAQTTVTARGEIARFEVVARTKARANWRARVRMTAGLGNPYSTWARAMNAEERCVSGPGGTVCTFTGTPCRG